MSTQPVDFSIKDTSQPSTLTVFKDAATGRLRWLAVSSTAFKDRDGQIVSTKALEQDVARTDAGADLGPFRFWHVPGLDIGTTDYSAMSGRTLIESGLFTDDRIGQAVKDSPKPWGISLGFLHPLSEPDSSGTFNSIQRFERSLVPANRASNLFTRLVIKEVQVLTPEKLTEFKELIRNDPDILQVLLSQVQQAEKTEKQADGIGVASKDTPAPSTEPSTPALDVAALESRITQSVVNALQPVFAQMTTQATTKDAEQAALKTQIAANEQALATYKATIDQTNASIQALKTKLDELLGEQPSASGYRPSQANDNIIPDGHALKNAMPQAVDLAQHFGFVK